MTWQTPAANLKVKTSANDFWTLLSNLKPTDSVATSSQAPGTIATCAQVTGKKTVAELLITAPTPPIVTPPASGDGTATITWTACQKNTDGSVCAPTGYNLYWGTNPASLAKISLPVTPLSYTLSNLASGTYYFAMTTQVGLVESDRTNLASKTVVASSTPPVIPPTTSVYHVKAITTGTRPATEAVLPLAGTTLGLGYKLGDIAVGKPCGDTAIIRSGSNEYHSVFEADVVLLSPTYKGRQLVAVCGK